MRPFDRTRFRPSSWCLNRCSALAASPNARAVSWAENMSMKSWTKGPWWVTQQASSVGWNFSRASVW